MTMSAPMIVSPMNVTNSAGTVRSGAMKSMTRIAAASRIAATNGAMIVRSEAVTGALLPPQPEGDRRGLPDGGQGRAHGAGDEVEDETREQAEDDDERAERHERHGLDGLHVGEVAAEALEELGQVAERDPLEHPQQVARGEDHHERGDRGSGVAHLERPDERQELADEAGQAGQTDRGEDEEAERRGVDRHRGAEPAHLRDRAVVGPLVDDADEEEQRAGD